MKISKESVRKIYVIFSCTAAVAAVIMICLFAGLIISMNNSLKEAKELIAESREVTEESYTAPVMSKEDIPEAEEPQPAYEPAPEPDPEPIIREFAPIFPIAGKTGSQYSGDKPVFSAVYKDWRVHKGIDIEAEENTPVLAAEDGIVSEMYTTPNEGTVIVLKHNDGYISVYKNLSTPEMVSIGDTVSREQIISGVGNNKNFEADKPAHLHYELSKDGEDVDPYSFFEK